VVIGLVQAQISIPESRSLKDKRSVLRGLKDRAVAHMNVSVAEVGDQDLWQSARLAFVTVAATREVVEQRLAEIRRYLQGNPRWVLMDVETSLF
jgi:uncharacterized protein YlxP (DUF503 family)